MRFQRPIEGSRSSKIYHEADDGSSIHYCQHESGAVFDVEYHPPSGEHDSLVDVLMNRGRSKAAVERALAEMAQGIITGIERSSVSVFDAWDELFNIANYRSIRRHRLSRTIDELFTWGMELSNVARLAPDGLPESLEHMSKLAIRIMQSRRRRRAA